MDDRELTQPLDLVTVATYRSVHEAHLARGLLEVNDIPSHIPDENAMRLGKPGPGSSFQVRLEVRRDDARLAAELLGQAEVDFDEPTPAVQPPSTCPDCGNQNSEPDGSLISTLFSLLLLGLPWLLGGRRVRCTLCGRAWRKR